jgi:putative IMPACT (imprinted ancient) family translation regulator
MSSVVKLKESTYQSLLKIYKASEKNPNAVREVIKKNNIAKSTWINFFEIYSSNEFSTTAEAKEEKKKFSEFCSKFTAHGNVFSDEYSYDGVEVDWDALIKQ